jgi:hypothetical protein
MEQPKEDKQKKEEVYFIPADNLNVYSSDNKKLREFFDTHEILAKKGLRAMVLGYLGKERVFFRTFATRKLMEHEGSYFPAYSMFIYYDDKNLPCLKLKLMKPNFPFFEGNIVNDTYLQENTEIAYHICQIGEDGSDLKPEDEIYAKSPDGMLSAQVEKPVNQRSIKQHRVHVYVDRIKLLHKVLEASPQVELKPEHKKTKKNLEIVAAQKPKSWLSCLCQ